MARKTSIQTTVSLTPMTLNTPWWRLQASDADTQAIAADTLVSMLEQLILIRRFEEKLLTLSVAGILHGPAHSSIGQEGAAVGAMSVLDAYDKINGTHRMHHQFLAKALNHVMPQAYAPLNQPVPDAYRDVVYRTYAEILGLAPGWCGGRGGSMHLRHPEAGIMGSNAIVGGNPAHAVGYALADKLRGADHVSVAFFGDGAMQNGAVYEAMNLAALYRTPTVFFVENNLYAVSTHVSEQTRETRLAARGLGLGIPGIAFDGMDVVAARLAMREARAIIAKEGGPVLLEAQTYRYFHQSGAQRGSAFRYRSKDEEAQWQARDPLLTFTTQLKILGHIAEANIAALEDRVRDVIDGALSRLLEHYGDEKAQCIRALWPDASRVEEGIRSDLSALAACRIAELEDQAPEGLVDAKFQDVIAQAMLRNMQRDERIFILGEDVHRLKGGTAGATKGIDEAFPTRLIGTPICENGFTGLALGAALNGMRPVVEIMYPDFALVAADQLFNQIAKVRHMFGGGFAVPVLVRSRVTAGTGYGSQHSMDASGLFAQYPGWRILAPSRPWDYIGLLNAALRCDDPVLLVEYNTLFKDVGKVPVADWDYIVPIGRARIARAGTRCTIVTYGNMVDVCCQVADRTGIDAQVIDLRTLDPLGLDWDTIAAGVRQTQALMVVEQTTRGTSIGSRLVSDAQARLFDWLDHEIVHVTGSNASPVVSKVLEAAALASADAVESALRALNARRGGVR